MIQSKNDNKRSSRAAPGKNKKFKLEIVTVILLAVVVCSVFLYRTIANTTGYWAGTTPAARNFITVKINGPNNTSGTMRVYFYTSTDYKRDEFIASSHGVRVTSKDPASETPEFDNPTGSYSLNLSGQVPNTTLTSADSDGKRWYEVVTYTMTFKLPAHYKVTSVAGDHPDKDSRNIVSLSANGKTFNTNTHVSSDTTVTITNEINLKQTGMLSTDDSTDSSSRQHATITINLAVDNYSLTYKPNGGTITNANGGTEKSGNVVYTKACGQSVSQSPTVTKDGYKLDGWYFDDGTKLSLPYKLCGSNKTVTAKWVKNDVAVSFDANGGTGSMSNQTMQPGVATNVNANTFTRSGYTFIGWSEERYTVDLVCKDKGKYTASDKGGTLYAQWRKNGSGFIQRPFMDTDMFYKASGIEGENGTTYDNQKTDSSMAHIDTNDNPGYFSQR